MEISSQKPGMLRTSAKLSLVCLLTVISFFSQGLDLTAFEAKYKAFHFGREVGEATMQLEDLGRDKYKLAYNSKASLFFLSDKRQELSLFSLRENRIVPHKYTYKRTGTGKKKSLQATFDTEKNQINFEKIDSMSWNGELDNQLYRLDLQMKLAKGESEFEYTLLNYRGQKRQYRLKVMGREQLDLPYGKLEGIKVKIMRESKKRETFAWFSPQLNYQLVRLQQFKEGDEQGDIQLSEYKGKITETTTALNN